MKYTIIKRYKDIALNRVFNLGEEIEIKDLKRINELKECGCIKSAIKTRRKKND